MVKNWRFVKTEQWNENWNDLWSHQVSEIPLGNSHPGAFGFIRVNHIHEGIDVYLPEGTEVLSPLSGYCLGIIKFTGESVGSPWWNETEAIIIDGGDELWLFGELVISDKVRVGDWINEGDLIGCVTCVLKKDKGRPKSMVHIQCHEKNTGETQWREAWNINEKKPWHLKNPTEQVIQWLGN